MKYCTIEDMLGDLLTEALIKDRHYILTKALELKAL